MKLLFFFNNDHRSLSRHSKMKLPIKKINSRISSFTLHTSHSVQSYTDNSTSNPLRVCEPPEPLLRNGGPEVRAAPVKPKASRRRRRRQNRSRRRQNHFARWISDLKHGSDDAIHQMHPKYREMFSRKIVFSLKTFIRSIFEN